MRIRIGDKRIGEIQKLAEKYGAEDYSVKRIAGETYLIIRKPYTYRNISVKPDVFKAFKQKKMQYMDAAGITKLTDSDFLQMILDGETK